MKRLPQNRNMIMQSDISIRRLGYHRFPIDSCQLIDILGFLKKIF